ncbi:MAG: DNA-binding protein [Burkholderiaceae bacterium]|jgi:predicted DNA-binding protein with PD1-like motif|nr:DNA-binding protein [Burkholderiaceae bacterium]
MKRGFLLSVALLLLHGAVLAQPSAPPAESGETALYAYRKLGNRYIVSIKNQQEIVAALKAFCQAQRVRSGSITGIGAVNAATLRFIDTSSRRFTEKMFSEQLEMTNLSGNVSTLDGALYLHLHITLGRADYTAIGGHLIAATINGAGEIVIDDWQSPLERTYDEAVGVNFYDFKK